MSSLFSYYSGVTTLSSSRDAVGRDSSPRALGTRECSALGAVAPCHPGDPVEHHAPRGELGIAHGTTISCSYTGEPGACHQGAAPSLARRRGDHHLLMVIGNPTWDTSVTVIWKRLYKTVKALRSHGVSATV